MPRGLVHRSKGTIEDWSIYNGMVFGTLILAANQAHEGGYIRTSKVKEQYLNHPQRGDRVLEDVPAGYRNDPPDSSLIQQDWSKWHLILHDTIYYSKFKSYEEWERFYS